MFRNRGIFRIPSNKYDEVLIFRTLKYSVFRLQFIQSLAIFSTLLYSSPSMLRAQGILRSLTKMYDGLFSTEPCVTLVYSELEAYSEPCQISMLESFIHNLYSQPCVTIIFRTVAYSESEACSEYYQTSIKIYFIRNLMYNPDIFRTLSIFRNLVYSEIKAYSEPCRISKMGHFIKNPV